MADREEKATAEERARESARENRDLHISSIDVNSLDRRIVDRTLKTGLKSEISCFIDKYFAALGERNIQSFLFRQYITMNVYFSAVSMLQQMGYRPDRLVESCGDVQKMSAALGTVAQTKEYWRNLLETAIDLREAVSRKKYRLLLQDAQNYIEQNYNREDISLNTVAASVNLSANHFSAIFSQEMGRTFIEFLTAVRMEKAKELLRGTSKKIAEVAYSVGYRDSHYFSYLFKKTQGCTPGEFRRK